MSSAEPQSTVANNMAGSAFDLIQVPKINSYKRTRVERARLWRKLERVSKSATDAQTARFGKMRQNVLGPGNHSQLGNYFSMNAVTLTRENQHHIDPRGFFTMKADGVGGLAAWTANSTTETADNPRTTMLFVTRDGAVRAIPFVPLFVDKLVVMDAEMCLCRKKLSNDEFWRVTNGFNVHNKDYLDYYTFRDAEALKTHGMDYDIACDAHQMQYDDLYELCCAVFDIMFYGTKCLSLKYPDRIALINETLETDFVKPTVARRKRMVEIERVVATIGGHEMTPLRLFLKPVVPIHCINSAFHALQPSMYGVRVDGVIFMRSDQPYTVGFAPHVLKWKPLHSQTVDFTIIREASIDGAGGAVDDDDNATYTLCIALSNGGLVKVSQHVLDDTSVAMTLLRDCTNTSQALLPEWRLVGGTREKFKVVECQPIVAGGADLPGANDRSSLQRKLWWRPIEWRVEKEQPNSRANYEGVCRALLNPLTEDDLIALIKNSNLPPPAPAGATPVPASVSVNVEELAPIDLPLDEAPEILD